MKRTPEWDESQNHLINNKDIGRDDEGRPIQAHGGGMLLADGVFYWYGENRDGATYKLDEITTWDCRRTDFTGITCYSSKDLVHWRNEGLALRGGNPCGDLHASGVVERPKVIYNDTTRQYVMWMHIDDRTYSSAKTGVAVSADPVGPFTYLGSFRPNGEESRDMTVFKDDDGKAWLFYSSENNRTMHVAKLADDYLSVEDPHVSLLEGMSREAPVVFKDGNRYYLVTSGCSGFDPNSANYAVADHIPGPWTPMGNPCSGNNAEKTFGGQGAHVFRIPDTNRPVFMADIWNKDDLGASRYFWLPMDVRNGVIILEWHDAWPLS